jgi:Ras-related protein Rab-5C
MIQSAKIMLLGDIAVGKTSLAKRLVFNRFDSDYKTTIGVNVLSHEVNLGDDGSDMMRLVIWDTDGDFSHTIFSTTYIVGAAGAIVVADASRPATIDKMASLVDAFEDRFPGRPVSAVLNKSDLAPETPSTLKMSLRFRDLVRTSALTGEGVASLFITMAQSIRRRGL